MQKEQYEHEKYEKQIKDDPNITYGPCRNCKRELRKKIRRCPYCGILNPTVTLKEIFVTMAGVVIFMGIFTYFFNK